MNAPVAVAVALLRLPDGRILLCQRSHAKSYPLRWEFPGGKVEPGETSATGLRRELLEELGIDAVIGRQIHQERSHYPDGGTYDVTFHLVERWAGEPVNMVFEALRWVAPEELLAFDLLEGNLAYCRRLASEGLPA